MKFSELKESARKSMKGYYKDAIIMVVVIAIIAAAGGFIAGILDNALGLVKTEEVVIFGVKATSKTAGIFTPLVEIVVSSLFTFGMLSFFLKRSRNEEVTWKEVFSKTNLCIYFFVVSIICGVFVTLWSLLLIIPGIIASFAYSMVYLVKLDDPEIGYLDAIKKSKELMKGHKWEYFLFNLSFIGWAILSVFTFGILAFWLVPYMSVAQCNFYNKLIEK